MYYISKVSNGKVTIVDTKDGVEEQYSTIDLKNFVINKGLKVLGTNVDENGFYSISSVRKIQDNLLVCNSGRFQIYNIAKNEKVFELSNHDIRYYDSRNNPYIIGFSIPARGRYKGKDKVGISLSVSVKYDIEFTGEILGILDLKHPQWTHFLNEVMYFENDYDDIVEQTCGDCPEFRDREDIKDIFKNQLGLDYVK